MAKSYYLPKDDSGKAELLEHLAARLPVYADVLEISPADITSLQADAAAFRYTLGAFNAIQANSRLWTAFKTIQRDGGTGSTAFPHAPNLPAPVPAVPLGIIPRLTALVSRLKTARNYTEAIGQDLKIVGAEQTVDSSAWKPILDLATEAGHPIINGPRATPTPSRSGPTAATTRASSSPPPPPPPASPTPPPNPAPAPSGSTRRSTASATPRSASGATW